MVFSFKENRVRRSYTGGMQIDKFMEKEICEDSNCPEEWLASTVEAVNPDFTPIENEGLSICQNGRLFRDEVNEKKERIFGKRLNEKYGGKFAILVKLLDSAERLVIQCHPTADFAKEHFGSPFGKTECWYFLNTKPEACVFLGFKEGITREKWKVLFDKQDVGGMLDCLHKFPVKKGDLWFVDGGVPHAIGEGCFMIELQEPTDLMVIPERKSPSGSNLSESKLHGGLGFDRMFDCFSYNGKSSEETKKLYYRKAEFEDNKVKHIVDNTLTDKFSMSGLRVSGEKRVEIKDTYSVCIVIQGECELHSKDYSPFTLRKGQSIFVGADTGEIFFKGNADIVICSA